MQECLLLVTEVRPGHRSGRRQYALRYVGPDDQMLEVLAKPVKLPDDKHIASAHKGECLHETPGRSAFAPLMVSVKIFSHPARVSASFCTSRFWSKVETRA